MPFFPHDSAVGGFRSLVRPAIQVSREIPPFAASLRQGRAGPLAIFLPCEGRQGAALLRIYNVAAGLRARGWRALVLSPKLTLAARHRVIARTRPDLLVMQGVRHALNRPHLYPGWPLAFDMDDADFHLPHLEPALRRAMPQVTLVLAGSAYVAEWCRDAGAGAAHVIWTGAPVSQRPHRGHGLRAPVVAWAQTRPMTYTREAAHVRRVMAKLSHDNADVRLRLFDRQPGDDPGFETWFNAAGIQTEWRKKANYSDFLTSLDEVALGFAPLSVATPFSRGKSFGKVLAYLDAQVPVLASDACEHGAFFTPATGILSNDPDLWVSEARRLLADPAGRDRMAKAAYQAFRRDLSVTAMVSKIDPILRRVVVAKRAA